MAVTSPIRPTTASVPPAAVIVSASPTHAEPAVGPHEVDRFESRPVTAEPKKQGFFARLFAAIGRFFAALFGRKAAAAEPTQSTQRTPTVRRNSSEQPPVRVATADALAPPGTAPVASDPGSRGPYAVDKQRIEIRLPNGRINRAYVYLPRGDGPFSPTIYTSGLLGAQSHGTGTATQLASHGMITIVPDIGINASPPRSAEIVRGVIDWLHQDNELSSRVRLDRGVGLIGHSFGGLTAILAGSDPRVGAVVALDPNDNTGRDGAENAHRVSAPVAVLRGEVSLGNGLSQGIVDHLPAGKQHYKILGAHHFDFMSTSSRGYKNEENRSAMRYATAFLLSKLLGRTDMDAYTGNGARIRAAAQRGELEVWAAE